MGLYCGQWMSVCVCVCVCVHVHVRVCRKGGGVWMIAE